MARWLISLAVALLLALALHGVALWGIHQELQAMASVIAPHADPMFTRQITQAAVAGGQGPVILMPKQAAAHQNIAVAAPKSVVNSTQKPPQLESQAQLEPERIAPEPTPTVVPSTPTDAALAAASPSTPSTALLASPTTAQADAARDASVAAQAASSNPSPDASATFGNGAALALQGQWPADTRLSYQLGGYYRGDLHGDAQVQWTRPPAPDAQPSDRYQVRIDISLGLAKAQMTSQGRVRATGLQPQVYEEQLPSRSARSVKLDAQDVQLADGRRIPRPAQDLSLVQDAASQFVELGYRFSTGRAVLKQGETISVWLARPGGLDEWVYDIGPAETIYLPLMGAVQTHHLKPRPLETARGSITAEMWIAPSLQHLPVRIKITLNKEAYLDLLVRKIEQL
jgi:outer membrane biosynthesis protein TonB